MAKFLLCVFVCLTFEVTCMGTLYTVGDTAGWDISSALDQWSTGKTFNVGDNLFFQYSSYHSVNELTKDHYKVCNVSNPIMSRSDGNTTIPLSSAGERYFACGNRLHCLGGMKLQVTTVANSTATPQGGAPSSLPSPSTKRTVPTNPTSSGFSQGGTYSLLLVCIISVMGNVLFSFGN